MDFNGCLNDDLCGLYRSKYIVKGEEKYMAVSHFESSYARRAFPCWDEPAFKAKFDISITTSSDRIAISNMDVCQKSTLPDGRIVLI